MKRSKKRPVVKEGRFEASNTVERMRAELAHAERRAWESLARYKFQMFGYWAAIWVHLNRLGEFKRPNPWRTLVIDAGSWRPQP